MALVSPEVKVLAQHIDERMAIYHGDSCEVVKGIPDASVGFSVFSPPFASLYTYSASERDMGNVRSEDEFFAHFEFLIRDLLRATKPGRLCSVHCMDLPMTKEKHGEIAIYDFPGEISRAFRSAGWLLHARVTIRKDPVTQMQRTKSIGLLHKQIKKDSTVSRMALADYVLTFRRPGANAVDDRVSHSGAKGDISVDEWQQLAEPVWMDIDPNDTLQYQSAREHDDERHICPLQLPVIRRLLLLWSKPGDVVFSPFMGIGSEGYESLKAGRRFVGCELKRSYFGQALRNLLAVPIQGALFGAGAVA